MARVCFSVSILDAAAPVVIPTTKNAPIPSDPDTKWPCSPQSFLGGAYVNFATRYRFIVYAPTGTTKLQVEIGVGNAGFFSGDVVVQDCHGIIDPTQPGDWGVNDPSTLLWHEVPGMSEWCVEATYIGPSIHDQILCAQAMGCWPGWTFDANWHDCKPPPGQEQPPEDRPADAPPANDWPPAWTATTANDARTPKTSSVLRVALGVLALLGIGYAVTHREKR